MTDIMNDINNSIRRPSLPCRYRSGNRSIIPHQIELIYMKKTRKVNLREESFNILRNIEKQDAYVGDVLDGALRRMQFCDKKERAFITRLVEGVIERRISLDFLIDKFSKKKAKVSDTNKLYDRQKDVRMLLRMGIYQIRYMESVPAHAAISETVELAKKLKYTAESGYINAVLRKVSEAYAEGKLDSYLVSRMDTRYSTPKWLCDFLVQTYGKEKATGILQDQFEEHQTVIRVNTLKTDVDTLRNSFIEAGVTVSEGLLYKNALRISDYDMIKRLPGYSEGEFIVQDETSCYAVNSIGIKPGDKILDLCASPGGKSLLAYELAYPGTVISCDISREKLDRIAENAQRLGIDSCNITSVEELYNNTDIKKDFSVLINDATKLNKAIASLPEEDKFDVVIADVPCSGLGIMGRKNDIKYHTTPDAMEQLAQQGLKILINASHYVKKGGRIGFSTCTINPGEDQEVVRKFLDYYNETTESDEKKGKIEIIDEKAFLQGIDGSDGFYYAVLELM